MLEIIGLSKHYGDVKVVTDLNLTIEGGEIFTMLGANGAGKTTTLMVALGFTEPTKWGRDIGSYRQRTNPVSRRMGSISDRSFFEGGF